MSSNTRFSHCSPKSQNMILCAVCVKCFRFPRSKLIYLLCLNTLDQTKYIGGPDLAQNCQVGTSDLILTLRF